MPRFRDLYLSLRALEDWERYFDGSLIWYLTAALQKEPRPTRDGTGLIYDGPGPRRPRFVIKGRTVVQVWRRHMPPAELMRRKALRWYRRKGRRGWPRRA